MSLFSGDVIISECIKLGLEDLKKNMWLFDDIFGQFVQVEALKVKYGQAEIDRAKEWFLNNPIDVYMQYRIDKDRMPCITIGMGSSSEKEDMKHLGDLSTEVETLMPNQIGKPIPYIVKPFVPTSYDIDTGLLSIPSSIRTTMVGPGMILVDPEEGSGYIIKEIDSDGIYIEAGLELTGSKFGIIPKYQFYKARREHSYFEENFHIGCHVHGDPAALLWLHAIVVYILLRYRESLLEGHCFAQSTFSSSDMAPNQAFGQVGGENVFSRYVTLSGQVENSWLKSPKRIIEAVEIIDTTDGIKSGIKILSNQDSPDNLDTEDDSWTTIDENPED